MEKELIIPELKSRNKDEVIKEITAKFQETGVIKDEDVFIKAIKTREAFESTAIGGCIAIPHARSDTVKRLTVALGKSTEGVGFESLDSRPVHLIFMIACPSNVTKTYLQVLARIARLCKNENIKEGLIKAKDTDEIMCFIKSFDIGPSKPEAVKLKDGRIIYPNKNSVNQ